MDDTIFSKPMETHGSGDAVVRRKEKEIADRAEPETVIRKVAGRSVTGKRSG